MMQMSVDFARSGLLLALASYIGPGHAVVSGANGTSCCARLSSVLPARVSYPNSTAYDASVSSYWAQQEQQITPSCILSPTEAEEVSVALGEVLVPGSCKFAVRSGGHGSVTGVANIEGGVTIDLRGINSTVISDDRTSVSVGGGQTLGNVYSLLAGYGVAIPGARDSGIGVGGSTLGGGIGYFAPSQGFAADSVIEYEVVLASGRIVTASERENRDLWRALKGGGSNFGVVVRFVFRTFPLGQIWAGDAEYYGSASTVEATARALYNFASNPDYDADASLFVVYGYNGEALILNEYTYAAPVSNPPAFAEFFAVPGQIANTTAVTTLPDLSLGSEEASPDGYQQITFAISFENSLQILLEVWEVFNSSSASIDGVQGASWSLTLEPIVPSLIAQSEAKGGDILGIEVPPEGLILTVCSAQFDLAADYPYMSKVTEQLLADLTASAERLGVHNRYIDMNHAKAGQNPIAGYGEENWEFLNATAEMYDPSGVFQTLVPGGFKL